MKWTKRGLLFDPGRHPLPDGCTEFAQSPQALVFDDFVRIYFSTRAPRRRRPVPEPHRLRRRRQAAAARAAHVDRPGDAARRARVFRRARHLPDQRRPARRQDPRLHLRLEPPRVGAGGDRHRPGGQPRRGTHVRARRPRPGDGADARASRFSSAIPSCSCTTAVWHMWYIYGTSWVREPGRARAGAGLQDRPRDVRRRPGVAARRRADHRRTRSAPTSARRCRRCSQCDGRWHMYFCYRYATDFRDQSAARLSPRLRLVRRPAALDARRRGRRASTSRPRVGTRRCTAILTCSGATITPTCSTTAMRSAAPVLALRSGAIRWNDIDRDYDRETRRRAGPQVRLHVRPRRDAPVHAAVVRAVLQGGQPARTGQLSRRLHQTADRRASPTSPASKRRARRWRRRAQRCGDSVRSFTARSRPCRSTARFDNIVLTHVLEHLDDPVAVLARVNREWLSRDRPAVPGVPERQRRVAADRGPHGPDQPQCGGHAGREGARPSHHLFARHARARCPGRPA